MRDQTEDEEKWSVEMEGSPAGLLDFMMKLKCPDHSKVKLHDSMAEGDD